MAKLTIKDLKTCDVLLCRGTGLLSDMIVRLDGGSYSHAAFYDGNSFVVHAIGKGVLREHIEALKEVSKVDVFRFKKNGHQLGREGYPIEPLLDTAQAFVDAELNFASTHLMLLSILVVTRKIPLDAEEKKMLRIVLDNAMDQLFDIINRGEQPMVCSELVYRCYDEAAEDKRYQLTITGLIVETLMNMIQTSRLEADKLFSMGLQEDLEFEQSKQKFLELWLKIKHREDIDLIVNKSTVVASCVTPRDLEESIDLEKKGELIL